MIGSLARAPNKEKRVSVFLEETIPETIGMLQDETFVVPQTCILLICANHQLLLLFILPIVDQIIMHLVIQI